MQENARLRTLVGNLSDFIGRGLGGLVSDLGLTAQGVEAIANEGYFDMLSRHSQELDQAAEQKQRESADPPTHWTKQPGATDLPARTDSARAPVISEELKAKVKNAELHHHVEVLSANNDLSWGNAHVVPGLTSPQRDVGGLTHKEGH